MNITKNGILIITLSIFLVAGQFGCTTANQNARLASASIPTDNTINKLKVVIVPVTDTPHIKCIAYDKGRGRAASKGASELGKKGAIGGALFPIHALAQGGDPRGAALILVLLPVLVPTCALGGAVIGSSAGAIGGAVKGDYREMPMNTVTELQELSSNLTAMTKLNRSLAGHLMLSGQALTNNEYAVADLANQHNDVDVVLKVNITKLLFKGEIESDPDIGFEMSVNVEITDPAESIYFSDHFNYISNKIELSDWIEEKGLPLQKEFNLCYQELSQRIIKEMFISNEQFLAAFLSDENTHAIED